ncbi:redoxin family protein [Tundrisphaera sp. TA3]|uniref:redoxin family protein n=1 Tax=Tundrisphaera sp. TA3 TaxID=3435775 RepID=UPI003EB92D58
MGRILPRLGMVALVCGGLAWPAADAARAEDRTADQVVAELDAIKFPEFDRAKMNDRAAIEKYIGLRKEVAAKRAVLIEELYKIKPEDARLVKLMKDHWREKLMTANPTKNKGEADELGAQVQKIIADNKNETLVAEAAYFRASRALMEAGRDAGPDAMMAIVEEFQKAVPKDPRAATLLYQIANATQDTDRKKELFDRIVRDYPDSPTVKRIEGARRQIEGIGKPFKLEFTDAIKGSPVSIEGLKGKVVVIDFWATWCGPCIAEMPKMKKLYAEYKDKGVEFIGVSLDQAKEDGGLDKLKEYVEKNDIQWPQYYQGNYWESEFSMGWGINAIPCVFLVDAEGNLASVQARGKLEEMIPEYLSKAKVASQ